MDENQQKHFNILSLDGGGAKGFYSLGVLAEIESLTGHLLYKKFDLIYGTSTGAIIAGLLAKGESVETIRALYEKHVPAVMKNQRTGKRTRALRSLAHEVFGDCTAADLKTACSIVATNWHDDQPLIFKNRASQAYAAKSSFVPYFGVKVADAVIASCSAYPFFLPHKITKSTKGIVEATDGGFCANNPTNYAIADALSALGQPRDNLRVISLGVGKYPPTSLWRILRRLVSNIALVRHAASSEFLQKLLDTNTRSMEFLTGILFKDVALVRINDEFPEPDMATDLLEHDLLKLNRLVEKGRISFRNFEPKIRELLGVELG